FYSCYFKYESDTTDILKFLSNLKTQQPDISDSTFVELDGTEMKDHLQFIESEMPKFKKEILFFYEIEDIQNLEFYRCNKFPNANYLAIYIDNGIIYHLIESYWE